MYDNKSCARRLPLTAISLLLVCTTPQSAEPADLKPWTLSISGGGETSDDSGDSAPYAGVSLRRNFGNHSLSAGFDYSKTLSDDLASTNNVRARVYQGSLGYGYAIGRYTLESHASYGNRTFDQVTTPIANPLPGLPAIQVQTVSDGRQYGAGASASAGFGQLGALRIEPYLGVDWSRVDTVTQRNTRNGSSVGVATQQESGVSGTFGLSLTHGFLQARDFPVRMSVNGALLVASNGSAYTAASRIGTGIFSNTSPQNSGANGRQTWGQFGGALELDLGRRATLTLTAQRTEGFQPTDSISGGAALDFRF